jgi:hypothetical protein
LPQSVECSASRDTPLQQSMLSTDSTILLLRRVRMVRQAARGATISWEQVGADIVPRGEAPPRAAGAAGQANASMVVGLSSNVLDPRVARGRLPRAGRK